MDIIKKYDGEFGTFMINITGGQIYEDSLDRDKIWDYSEMKQEQVDIDAYKIQKFVYSHIMEQIFTEDLENDGIIWSWFFKDFGVEYQIETPKVSYTLIVDAEESYITRKEEKDESNGKTNH
jgi:hypothetical protein